MVSDAEQTPEPTPPPSSPPAKRDLVRRGVNGAFLLLGVALLVVLVLQLDVSVVVDRLLRSGWLLVPMFALHLVHCLVAAMAWRETFEGRPRLRLLFGVFLASNAINQVSPVVAAGEVLKGSMISREVRPGDIVASMVVYHYLNVWMMVLFTALGPALALLWVELPREVILPLLGVSAALAVGWAFIGWLLRRGLGGRLVRLIGRLRFLRAKNAEALEQRAAEVDRRIRDFRRDRPAGFRRALVFTALMRVTLVLEAFIVLWALAPEISPGRLLLLALVTQSTQQLINWAVVFVPGRIGVAEGGLALLFELLGLDPVTGLSFAVLRRLRKVLAIGAGLAVGTFMEATRRRESPASEAGPG